MPRFSIVIPVYNAESFLDRCVGSLLCQEYGDFEVLLIDDGSGDSSLVRCKEWEKKDSRIRVFNQDNKGAGTARNVGINNCTGVYVLFVDSDDEVKPNYLKALNEAVEKHGGPDVVEFKLEYVSPNGQRNIQGTSIAEGLYDKDYITQRFLPVMLQLTKDDSLHYTIFNVLRAIKRELLETNRVRFNEHIRRWEDTLFATEAFKYASSLAVVDFAPYVYYGHEGGGLGGRYDKNTYKYVFEMYKAIEAQFSDIYDTRTEYAINCEIQLLERCIKEICHNEKDDALVSVLLDIVRDESFINLCSAATGKDGIMCAKKYTLNGQHLKAVKAIIKYCRGLETKYRIKTTLKGIFKKCFFKG